MKGKRISSRKLINVLFLALKNMDAPLIYDLARGFAKEIWTKRRFLQKWTHPLEEYTFIKTIVRTRLVDSEKSVNSIKLVPVILRII